MSKKSKSKSSTSELTIRWELFEIPGLTETEQSCWKIRCLGQRRSDGRIVSQPLEQLMHWQRTNEREYKKLLRAIRYGGTNKVHRNQDLIRQDKKKRGGYEFKNTACKCRLFFFYDRDNGEIVICTNAYWKGKGAHECEQDKAFELCSRIKQLYIGKDNQHES